MSEIKKTQEENLRTLLEHSLRYGRSKQSPHTGYLHYCYQTLEDDEKSCIPLVENVLFALTLFHTRTMENINEAKELINKILYFQSQEGEYSTGNFPVYLHEFPQCKDRLVVATLLPAFYWIIKLYGSVLGADLKKRLEEAVKKGINHCLKAHGEKKLPFTFALKIGAAAAAFGKLLHEAEFEQKGTAILHELCTPAALDIACSPAAYAEVLVALQMVYGEFSASPWAFFWEFLAKTWHKGTCSYIGPSIREYQYAKEPQPTLYDLFFGVFSGEFSQRAFLPQAFLLQGSLIRPANDHVAELALPFTHQQKINGGQWSVYQQEHFAYCCYVSEDQSVVPVDKGMHDFRLIWGSPKHVHSFVCQGGNRKQTTIVNHDNSVEFLFSLAEMPVVEDREKSREAIFYFDVADRQRISVQGHKSTTFQIEEMVSLLSDAMKIQVHFEVVEGTGSFFGHIMKGNRASQLALRGDNRYQSYDWQLFMRTLRRSEDCVLKATVTFVPYNTV